MWHTHTGIHKHMSVGLLLSVSIHRSHYSVHMISSQWLVHCCCVVLDPLLCRVRLVEDIGVDVPWSGILCHSHTLLNHWRTPICLGLHQYGRRLSGASSGISTLPSYQWWGSAYSGSVGGCSSFPSILQGGLQVVLSPVEQCWFAWI